MPVALNAISFIRENSLVEWVCSQNILSTKRLKMARTFQGSRVRNLSLLILHWFFQMWVHNGGLSAAERVCDALLPTAQCGS